MGGERGEPLLRTGELRLAERDLAARHLGADAVAPLFGVEARARGGDLRAEHLRLGPQLRVLLADQHLPGRHARAGARVERGHEAVAGRAHDRLLRQPHHALRDGAQRRGDDEQQRRGRGRAGERHPHRAAAHQLEPRAAQHVPGGFEQRPHHAEEDAGDRHQRADHEELRGHEQRDGEQHEQPVGEGERRVEQQPRALARRDRGWLHVRAEQPPLRPMPPEAVGALAEVGDLQDVRERVVAVQAQQRVEVEDDGRDARHQHRGEQHRAQRPRLDQRPGHRAQRGDEQLHADARQRHARARPFGAEAGRRAAVHVGHGRERHEHHAQLVHLAPAGLRGVAVAQLVQQLEQREHQRRHQQPRRREHAVGQVARQLVPMHRRQRRAERDDREPHHRAERRDEPAHERQGRRQEPVRVPDRDLERERVARPPGELAPRLLAAPAQQLRRVGGDVGLKQVGLVQLAEQPHHGRLRRRLVAEAVHRRAPQLVHRAPPVHAAQDLVGGGGVAVHPARGRVLRHMPGLAAVAVAVQPRVGAQPRPQRGDAVPVRAEEALPAHNAFTATTSRAGCAPSRAASASRSRRGCARPRQAWRRPPCRGAAAHRGRPPPPRRGRRCARPARRPRG